VGHPGLPLRDRRHPRRPGDARGDGEAKQRGASAARRGARVAGLPRELINQSEGKRQGAINAAQGEAESIRLRAIAQADEIKLIAEANAESTRLAAEATADGLRSIAKAVNEPGGQDAMVQRLAERYVAELAEMAKASNMVIVPDRPNDLAGVVATAMGMFKEVDAKGAALAAKGGRATPASSDWLTTESATRNARADS